VTQEINGLLVAADRAPYHAKARGPGKWVVYGGVASIAPVFQRRQACHPPRDRAAAHPRPGDAAAQADPRDEARRRDAGWPWGQAYQSVDQRSPASGRLVSD
jgi:hypothetical protein